jgi:AP endonuclease-2
MEERREPPRIAAKYWDEFSTKQTRLQSFFTKKQTNGSVAAAPGPTTDATTSGNKTLVAPLLSSLVEPSEAVSPSQAPTDDLPSLLPTSSSPSTVTSHRSQPTSTSASMTASTSNRSSPQTQPEPTRKKPALVAPPSPPPKKKRKTTGQAKLSSFFGKPNAPSSSVSRTSSITNPEILDLTMDAEELSSQPQSDDADYLFARTLQNEEEGRPSDSTEGKAAWANLFAPLPPPLCTVHGEPAKKLTVTKQGPNKGKTFFICSRFVLIYR